MRVFTRSKRSFRADRYSQTSLDSNDSNCGPSQSAMPGKTHRTFQAILLTAIFSEKKLRRPKCLCDLLLWIFFSRRRWHTPLLAVPTPTLEDDNNFSDRFRLIGGIFGSS